MKTIISASRKTDIPAFYYDWLQGILKKKYVLVSNPQYPSNTSIIDLSPEKVNSIVLWSKDMSNVVKNPGFLENYNLYFQYTITGYNKMLEPNAPTYNDSLKTLEVLRTRYLPEQFNIRFDPIIISTSGEYQPTQNPYRARIVAFEKLCKDLILTGFDTSRITISFLSVYNKVAENFKRNNIDYMSLTEIDEIMIMKELAAIAQAYNFNIYTCANDRFVEANIPNVLKGHCIDGQLLTSLFDKCTNSKDTGQRIECGCAKSVDIGSYAQKCKHNCVYCYA